MTTNDEQYVPTDGPVRYQYVVNRMREGATRTHAEQEYTRWLTAHDARVRRDAEREAYTTARSVLAGEDPVEWARGAHGSSMSYPHAIGIMDDLIEDLDGEESP